MKRIAILTLATLFQADVMTAATFVTPPERPALPLVQVATDSTRFSATLQSYVDYCQTYAKAQYAVDCLSERLVFAASGLGNYGWERDVKAALLATSQGLDAVTAKYVSTTAPAVKLRATGSNPIRSTRPIRPVAPENVTRASAAASDVLEEAELTLLRSSSTSGASEVNALAFAQVAAVVGSAKVLLRSA